MIGVFGDPNTKKAAGFFADLEKPQSDAWWTMKTQIGYDGADACNVLDHAKQMALIEVSKNKYEGEDPTAEMRADANDSIDYWVGIMRTRLLAMKFLEHQGTPFSPHHPLRVLLEKPGQGAL